MINYAGSVSSYVKSLDMQWKAKKKWDEMNGKTPSPFAVAGTAMTTGWTLTQTKTHELSGINTEEVDYRLSQIVLKLKRGKKLSGADFDYLRQKDPALYAKALKIEEEREEYEKELKKCRTKEEVRKLNTIKNQLLIAEIKKAGASNSAEAAADLEMRFNAIKDAHEGFVKSKAFERLPEDFKEISEARDKRRGGASRAARSETDKKEDAWQPGLPAEERQVTAETADAASAKPPQSHSPDETGGSFWPEENAATKRQRGKRGITKEE